MSMRGKGSVSPLRGVSVRNKLAKDIIQFNKERMNQTYAFPATIQQAQIHELANVYGFNSLVEGDGTPVSVCSCCKLPINTMELPIDYPTTLDLNTVWISGEYKLSSGISLFFTFIKMAICYLILRFILTDSFNLISSGVAGTYCHRFGCGTKFTSQMSSYNKINEQNLVYVVDVLNLITIILSMVFFNLYRKVQYKMDNLINGSQHTQDDYTVFLKNIPILLLDQGVDPDNITFDYPDKIKKYIEGKLDDWLVKMNDVQPQNLEKIQQEYLDTIKDKRVENKKITSITMCFDISEMEILRDMRKKLMQKYVVQANDKQKEKNANSNQLIQEDKESTNYENLLNQIKLVNNEEILLSQKFAEDNSMAFNLTHFAGKAFVSFEYQHYRDYILRETYRDKDFLRIRKDYPMKVELAATPNDIIWYNMSVESSTRRKNILISYLILLMVLACAFAATLMLTKVKFQIQKNASTADDAWGPVLTIIMTIVTLVINALLSIIVKSLTQFQRHQTKSNFLFSHIIKVVITQFINTTIIYYVSSSLTNSVNLQEQGLVVQVSSLFLTSAVIQIALNLINPSAIIATVSKFIKYRNKTEVNMFQLDLNSQMQKAEFDVVDRYSYYILQIYACSFYSYLVPLATPCLIVTFCIQYWIDKYNLFKRSSCKNQMDFFLSRTILKIFQVSLFIFALGNFLFSIVLHKQYVNSVNVAALIITGVYALFIMFAPRHLQKKIFGSYEQIQKKAYSECMKERLFKEQYWTSNPATKFVKEIDINTKQEVVQQAEEVKFANQAEFMQAKMQLDLLLKNDDPKLDVSLFKSPKSNISAKSNALNVRNSKQQQL